MQGCVIALVAVFAVIAFVVAIQASNRASKALCGAGRVAAAAGSVVDQGTAAPPVEPQPEPMPPPVIVTPPPEPEPPPSAPPTSPSRSLHSKRSRSLRTASLSRLHPHAPTPAPRKPFDWESLIGVKLFSWIAGIALVLAAVFFLSYSVEHGWLSRRVRASLGIVDRRHPAARLRAARGAQLRVHRECDGRRGHRHPLRDALRDARAVASAAGRRRVRADADRHRDRGAAVDPARLRLHRPARTRGRLCHAGAAVDRREPPIGLFSYLLLLNAGLAWVAYSKALAAAHGSSALSSRSSTSGAGSASSSPRRSCRWRRRFSSCSPPRPRRRCGCGRRAARPNDVSTSSRSHRPVLPLLFAVYVAAVRATARGTTSSSHSCCSSPRASPLIAIFRGPDWLHPLGGATIALVSSSGAPTRTRPRRGLRCWRGSPASSCSSSQRSHSHRSRRRSSLPVFLFMFPAWRSAEDRDGIASTAVRRALRAACAHLRVCDPASGGACYVVACILRDRD